MCVLVLVGSAMLIAGARRRRIWKLAAGLFLIAAGLIAAYVHVTRDADPAPLDPNPTSSFQIVALGDSYISGEGADRYFRETDEPGPPRRNLCHRASSAYPYLVAEELDASLTFLACSGAITDDVIARGQYTHSPDGVAGASRQLDGLEAADPDLVLISIGGNDAGFGEIGVDCALPGLPDCRRAAAFWLRRLDAAVYPRLVRTYRAVRRAAGDAPVFAFTYPNPLGPRYCHDLAGLGQAEMSFVREVFAPRLNTIVRSAAARARVRVIDLEDAFEGYRFCEKPLGRTAANFVKVARTGGSPIARLGDLGKGSLHPNPFGHTKLAARALPVLRAAKEGRLAPLPPVPGPGERPPPFEVEELAAAPAGLASLPPGTACAEGRIVEIVRTSAEPSVRSLALDEAQPGSPVCYRTYRDRWRSRPAGADGRASVPIDVGSPGVASINEILVQGQPGAWRKVVVSRLGAADEAETPSPPSKLGLYLLVAAMLVVLVVAVAILARD